MDPEERTGGDPDHNNNSTMMTCCWLFLIHFLFIFLLMWLCPKIYRQHKAARWVLLMLLLLLFLPYIKYTMSHNTTRRPLGFIRGRLHSSGTHSIWQQNRTCMGDATRDRDDDDQYSNCRHSVTGLVEQLFRNVCSLD